MRIRRTEEPAQRALCNAVLFTVFTQHPLRILDRDDARHCSKASTAYSDRSLGLYFQVEQPLSAISPGRDHIVSAAVLVVANDFEHGPPRKAAVASLMRKQQEASAQQPAKP